MGGALKTSHRAVAKAVKLAVMASASVLAMGVQAHAQQTPGAVTPYYGNLRPFYGDLTPFHGNLRPFYGNLRPFYGNLRPFWGNLKPFWGNLRPFADTKDPSFWGSLSGYVDANNKYDGGQVAAFWGATGPKYDSILAAWSSASTPHDYAKVDQMLSGLVSDASSFWGDEVKKATHKSFGDGFANAMLARHGID